MSLIGWKLFVLYSFIGIIEAGVKIEISRVKDRPLSASAITSPNIDGDKNDITETETTEATTMPTTTVPTTLETTMKTTMESHIQKLSNSTLSALNSSTEVTTTAPLNMTGVMKPSQANITNTNTSIAYNTTLVAAKELNPYLSEFTRRQMRRRLIPADYYCPCDLKVMPFVICR